MSHPAAQPTPAARARKRQRGQSTAELALILPILAIIAVAIGDFGRIYASIVTLESGVREAADYGAFSDANWDEVKFPGSSAMTLSEMERRACTAVSTLPGYVGAPDNSTCSNPVFTFDGAAATTTGGVKVVRATATFTFHTAMSFPPLPDSVTLVRQARFAVSSFPLAAP
jgi:TadE-like protein